MLPSPFPETINEAGPNPHWIMNIGDDLQTSYELAGLSGEKLRGLAYFTPAIPDEATCSKCSSRTGRPLRALAAGRSRG